jgi:response regulator RpfG family c-di-GMP phosphodiesterase
LSKTTTQYKETIKIVKAYAEHFQRQDLTTKEMENKMTEMQVRVEREMALVTELRLRESALEEQNSNQQQQILRLQKLVESVQEHQTTENNVSQTIAGMVEASSSWCENSSALGNKIKELNELLQQR